MRAVHAAVLLSLAVSAALASDVASACAIILPHSVLPSSAPAPRNAHVWVYALPLPLFSGASFVLVDGENAAALPLTMKSWEASSVVWELTPLAPLSARGRYEVWAAQNGKKPILLDVFRTSDDEDKTPPTAPKVTGAREMPPAMTCPGWIEIEGTPGTDASGDVLHAVWLSDATGRIAYDTPPTTIVLWPPPVAGSPPPSASVQRTFDRRAPGKHRIGLRTVDVAGNLSVPVEVNVDIH